jgi:hypothetical protein
MKTTHSLPFLLITALISSAFPCTGCSGSEKAADAKAAQDSPPAKVPAIDPKAATPASVAVAEAPAPTAGEAWDAIKDSIYDKRADFAAGLGVMSDRLDLAISRLNTKRATLPQTSVKDWDFAMKEVTDAVADFKSKTNDLNKATPETWAETKDRIAQAWLRAKDAVDKVRTSTTS